MLEMVILDDDAIVRVTLAEALRDDGFQVAEAGSGAEAMRLLQDGGGAHVLVADIQLGGNPNGLAVASAAMRQWPGLHVVYVTGRPDALAGIQLGPRQQMLIKPFMPSYLVQLVRPMVPQKSPC